MEAVSTLIGRPAPVFSAAMIDGATFDLASLRGQVVVLDFWATWCPPCVESLPKTVQTADRYAAQGVRLYAVNAWDSAEKAGAFLTKNDIKVAVPLITDRSDILSRYNVQYIPQVVVIDRAGQVTAVSDGVASEEWLAEAIETAMNSGQAAQS